MGLLLHKKFRLEDLLILIILITPSYFKVFGIQIRLILVTILSLVILINNRHITFSLLNGRTKGIVLPLFLWAFILIFISLLYSNLLNAASTFILWLVLGLILYQTIDNKEQFLHLIDIIIVAGLICSIFGLIEEITHFNIFFLFNEGNEVIAISSRMRFGFLRIMSFTSHPITYCLFCMFVLFFINYKLSLKNSSKAIYGFAYVMVLINAFLTVSRSVLICIIISQLVLFLMQGYRRFIKRAFFVIAVSFIIGGFLWLVSDSFKNLINIIFLTIGAFFSDEYDILLLEAGFMGNNFDGIGQRLLLYNWVWEDVKDVWFLGLGPNANISRYFTNSSGYLQLKESIEVEYLRTLYRFGFFGMVSEVVMYFSILVKTVKKRALRLHFDQERKLNFSKVAIVLVITYLVSFFAVMQNEDMIVFFFFLQLVLSYVNKEGFSLKSNVSVKKGKEYNENSIFKRNIDVVS